MRATLLIMLACLFVSGCVTASYNPKTGEFAYSRLGDQKVNGFNATLNPLSTNVAFESQESSAAALSTATAQLADLVKILTEKLIAAPVVP